VIFKNYCIFAFHQKIKKQNTIVKNEVYLNGLNTLRFVAAVLVLITHAYQNLTNYGIFWLQSAPVMFKGTYAVEFFFTLSGFLLTYLALIEFEKTKTINWRLFYIRRIYRIFPMYFMSVFIGYFLLAFLYPFLKNETYLSFKFTEGIVYHLCFLPNWVTVKYEKVGSLFSLWSIGVEEQFYLLFPFLMFFLKKNKYALLLGLAITLFYSIIYFSIFPNFYTSKVIGNFLETLKFQYMLWGCTFAILQKSHQHLFLFIFKNKIIQGLVWALFAFTIFADISFDKYCILQMLTFGGILLVVSNVQNQLLNIEISPFVYLGTISFGIYIYHPYISYLLRFMLEKSFLFEKSVQNWPFLYYFLQLLITIIFAHYSFKYYESYFLRKKNAYKLNPDSLR
jgi:peptidoglycan/LPS O-acetylase OafA/YrhL